MTFDFLLAALVALGLLVYLTIVLLKPERIDLTLREFNLLCAFAGHPGRVMAHESLLEQVWCPAQRHDQDYLRVAVRALRRKLEDDPGQPRLVINEPACRFPA